MVFHDGRGVQDFIIAAIDPGTETLGVSLGGLNPVTLQQTYIEGFTMRGSVVNYRWAEVLHDGAGRDSRLLGLEDQLYNYFMRVRPHMIVYEDNYLGASPQSFKALIEACVAIKHAIWRYNAYIASYTVKPNQAKSIVNAIAKKGMDQFQRKELVRAGLSRYQRMPIHPAVLASLDEHSVDSAAILAYALNEVSNELALSQWITPSHPAIKAIPALQGIC